MENSENSLNQAVSMFLGKHRQDAPDLTKKLEICYPYDILCYLAHIKFNKKSISSASNNFTESSIPLTVFPDTSQQYIQRKPLHDEQIVKQKLTPYIPSDFQLGAAIGEGDCFFDTLAQGLNNLVEKEKFNAKSLRLLCNEYIQTQTNTEWVETAVIKQGGNYAKYLDRIQYTADEIKQLKQQGGMDLEQAEWGNPHIEGRIICQVLQAKYNINIKIHVIEINEASAEETGLGVLEELIDAVNVTSKVIISDNVYTDQNILHFVNYKNHFVPLFNNKIAPNKKPLTKLIEPTADSLIFQPNSNSLLKYIADANDLGTFKSQIIILCELANILQKPALFLVKKPLATSDEYLVGIYLNKELLLINPNGNLNLEKPFGQILNEIKKHLQISKFYISETKLVDKSITNLQLSSAICIELIHTFETLIDKNLLHLLTLLRNSNKQKNSYKFTFTILNIDDLLLDYLKQLTTFNQEREYQDVHLKLRQKHLNLLIQVFENTNLSIEEQNEILQTCLNTPAHSLIMKLQDKSCNFDNLQEQPEYKALLPKAVSESESVTNNSSVNPHKKKYSKTAMNQEVLAQKKSYFLVREYKHSFFNIQNTKAEPENSFDKKYQVLNQNNDIADLINFLEMTILETTDENIRYKAHFKLSQHYSKFGQYTLALEHINYAISQIEIVQNKISQDEFYFEQLSYCFNLKGLILKNLEHYSEAELYFNSSIELLPSGITYNSLGLLKEKQNKPDEATEQYKKAIKIDPKYGSPYLNLGLLLRNRAHTYPDYEKMKNNLDFSLILFDNALKYGANPSNCLSARAHTKFLLNNLTGAEADYKEAITLEPNLALYHSFLGSFYLKIEKYIDAKNYFQKALELDPKNIEAIFNLAYIACENDFISAEKTFNDLKSHPEYSTPSIMNLISIQLAQNKFSAALNLLDSLIQNNDDNILKFFNTHFYGQIGHLFTLFKCYAEAEKAYETGIKYCEIDVIKANYWYFIGNTRFDDGNYQSAIDAYQNAAQLHPSKKSIFDEFIDEARQLLQSVTQTGQKITTPRRSLSQVSFVPVIKHIEMLASERKKLPKNIINKNGTSYFNSIIPDELPSSGKCDNLEYNIENKLWYRIDLESSTRVLASSEIICDFVVLDNGHKSSPGYEIIFGNEIGHFNLAMGKEVLFAGGICLKEGNILHWNNCTGHYKTRNFAAEDVAVKTGLPFDRYFPREQLKIRLENVLNAVNSNMQKAAQELADLTGGNATTTQKLRKYIR